MDRDAIRAATERLRGILSNFEGSKTYRSPTTHSKDPDHVRESSPPQAERAEKRVLVCYGRVRGLDTLLESGSFKGFDSVVYVLSDQKYFIFNSDTDREYIEGNPERLGRRVAARHGRLTDLVLREAGSSGVPILISSSDIGLMDGHDGVFDYGPIASTDGLGDGNHPKVLAVYGDRAMWDSGDYDVVVSKTDGEVEVSDKTGQVTVLKATDIPRAVNIGVAGGGIVTDVRSFPLNYSVLREREYNGGFWINWASANKRIEKRLAKDTYRGSGPLDNFFDGFVEFCGMDPENLSGREAGVFWDFITGSFRKHYPDQKELDEFFREFNRLQVFELAAPKRS